MKHEQSGKEHLLRQHILCSALLELMHTQDFVSISIQALVDATGVGRASFYRNFKAKRTYYSRSLCV
ncbi:MAG: TetR/AcrR family transcriptional regulator [Faecalibacterium prausnitzii]